MPRPLVLFKADDKSCQCNSKDKNVVVRAKGDKRVSKRRQFVVSKRRRAIKSGVLSDPLVWG
jgi:hypothetical protein